VVTGGYSAPAAATGLSSHPTIALPRRGSPPALPSCPAASPQLPPALPCPASPSSAQLPRSFPGAPAEPALALLARTTPRCQAATAQPPAPAAPRPEVPAAELETAAAAAASSVGGSSCEGSRVDACPHQACPLAHTCGGNAAALPRRAGSRSSRPRRERALMAWDGTARGTVRRRTSQGAAAASGECASLPVGPHARVLYAVPHAL
jgi:hypothetical protein